MEEEKKEAVEKEPVAPAAEPTPEETRIAELEAENAKLTEESANYKLGMMKAKAKQGDDDLEETDEDRIRRIAREEANKVKIANNEAEKDALIKKVLKENSELKLANLNKNNVPPASIGSHSESNPVTDTVVTPEQLAAFKARNWTEKDVERYKKNLSRYSGR